MTINFVVYSMMGPVVGWALDKHGARVTATIGLAVGAVGFGIMSLQRSLPVYYMAYAITGLAFPAATMPSGKVVSAWFGKKRGRMMGLVGAGNNFGGLIAVNISSFFARSPDYGWEYAAAVFACISATLSVLYWLVVRDHPPTDHRDRGATVRIDDRTTGQLQEAEVAEEEQTGLLRSPGDGAAARSNSDERKDMYRLNPETVTKRDDRPVELSFGEAVQLPVFWTTALGMLSAMWTYPAVLEQLQPALLAEGLAPADAVSLVSAVATCGICGKLGSGLLSEKITARCVNEQHFLHSRVLIGPAQPVS
jgi:MFS family permease